jgi:hypothetical protein
MLVAVLGHGAAAFSAETTPGRMIAHEVNRRIRPQRYNRV